MTPVAVMGVVNVTPDSFSDGGRWSDPAAALAHGLDLAAAGAAYLDIGGESTRPGAEPVDAATELARVVPVITALAARLQGQAHRVTLSIDTMKPVVARAAVAAGAALWNDVDALRAPGAVEAAAELGCEVVLMHMRGRPQTMQAAPDYDDAMAEVEDFLLGRAAAAVAAGVDPARIWFDPGIGFGKRLEHNLSVLRGLDRLAGHGFRVLLGASRKRTVRMIDPTAVDPLDRLGGSLALHLYGASKGVAAVRAHDVRETVQALAVWAAVSQDGVARAPSTTFGGPPPPMLGGGSGIYAS